MEANPVILIDGLYPQRLDDFLDSARGRIWMAEQERAKYVVTYIHGGGGMAKQRVMQPKESRPQLTADDIQVGKSYRGKNPSKVGWAGELNDRTVLHVSAARLHVQYDSPAVASGRNYPTVTMEKFLKWASHEVF